MDKNLLNAGDKQAVRKRTPGPDFINCTASPLTSEEFKAASFRQRLEAWNEKIVHDNTILPLPTVFVVYSLIGALWWALWRYVVMDADPEGGIFQCGDRCLPFFSDLNMRRFIVYNVLHGVVGLGATSGLLGFRFKIAVGAPFLHFMTPGTLCCPLLPGLVGLLVRPCGSVPGRRSIFAVLSYAAYVATLTMALRAPEMNKEVLYPVYVSLAFCTIFDFSIFQAGRGEHYVYMMLCLTFVDWQHGAQVVQLGLWMWAGVAKCGPWFAHVIPFLTKDSMHTCCMFQGCMHKLTSKNHPHDRNANCFSVFVAWLAAALEIIFPALCCVPANPLANMAGVAGMTMYHIFIANTMPFASVFEWNYFCIIMAIYLFFPGIGAPAFALPTSPVLVYFLTAVSIIIPAVGQLNPNLVPFLLAYRPYMGNWRFSFYVLHKKALHKHEKLTTYENPFTEHNAVWFYSLLGRFGKQSAESMKEWPYILASSILCVPAYRPFISLMEKLCEDNGWNIDDLQFSHSEPYQNQVFGWSLGTGWIATRDCTVEAFNHTCGFAEKEMYFIQFEPAKPFPCGVHKVQYRCFDVTKGPREAQYQGSIPYAELAASQPTDLVLTDAQMQPGNSINGTFLSTYY